MTTLPLELQRLIFETTTKAFPWVSIRLLLVSSYVFDWVIPSVYHAVQLSMDKPPAGVCEGMPISSLIQYGTHVRYLMIDNSASLEGSKDLHRIFLACDRLEGFALPFAHLLLPLDCRNALLQCPLKRLFISLSCLFEEGNITTEAVVSPLFTNLTHFIVGDGFEEGGNLQSWSWINRLRKLTHLSVFYDRNPSLRSLLTAALSDQECKLEAIVLHDYCEDVSIEDEGCVKVDSAWKWTDMRLVSMEFYDEEHDWMLGAQRGRDRFVLAQERISRRKQEGANRNKD